MAINTDIRISVSFKDHRKRKRLKTLIGPDATDYLLDLWISAAMNRPTGVLDGMDELDIALEAGWDPEKKGDPSVFVSALVECKLLDCREDGVYVLHDWDEHQTYAMYAPARAEKAKKAAKKRWGNAESEKIDASGNAKNKTGNATSMPRVMLGDESSNPPSPTPIPKPKPNKNICVSVDEKSDDPEIDLPAEKPSNDGGARKKQSGKETDYPQEFEEFWKAYPRRKEKPKAYRCWCKEKKAGADPGQMLLAAKNYTAECAAKRTEEQYIKHAGTFLGPDRHWREYVSSSPSSGGNYANGRVLTDEQKKALEWEREQQEELMTLFGGADDYDPDEERRT